MAEGEVEAIARSCTAREGWTSRARVLGVCEGRERGNGDGGGGGGGGGGNICWVNEKVEVGGWWMVIVEVEKDGVEVDVCGECLRSSM